MDGWKEGCKKQMEDWMDRNIWMVGWIKIDGWLDGQKKNR